MTASCLLWASNWFMFVTSQWLIRVLWANDWFMCDMSQRLVHVLWANNWLRCVMSQWLIHVWCEPLIHMCYEPRTDSCVLRANEWFLSMSQWRIPVCYELMTVMSTMSRWLIHVCYEPMTASYVLWANDWFMCAMSYNNWFICAMSYNNWFICAMNYNNWFMWAVCAKLQSESTRVLLKHFIVFDDTIYKSHRGFDFQQCSYTNCHQSSSTGAPRTSFTGNPREIGPP